MTNVIVNRVKEFLKRYPPFSFLSDELLDSLAAEVELKYYSKDEYLFYKGDPARNYFFVLKEGSVMLTEDRNDVPKVIEYCDEGDVFGVLALLGKRPYVLNALANEDSLVYAIPVKIFEKILQENSRVSMYFAAGFASGQVVVRTDLSQAQKARTLFATNSRDSGLMIFSGQSVINFSSDVLACYLKDTIGEAAKKMSEKEVGSIVVLDEKKLPKGIITDRDLRNKVIAAGKTPDTKVEEIMSSPVITMSKDTDFAMLYLSMIKNRLHHLIFTEDGTSQSKVVGIVSDHDILLSQGNSPAVIINALINSNSVEELARLRDQAELLLKYYLENEISMNFVADIISEINDIVIQRAIDMAKKKHDANYEEVKNTKFCFMSLGSEGRGEQLLRTDLDNALVFEDVAENKQDLVLEYFHVIAREVIDILIACGFQTCPADIMANNPRWCQPLSVWKDYFGHWIKVPDQESMLHASIFFDFRPVSGSKLLTEEISLHIYGLIEKNRLFLTFLAKNALLNPPPLGFFRNFLVEKSGEHQDKFDIKLRAMMPLADAARLLVLSNKIIGINNTFKRFEKLAELEPSQAELYLEAGKAYEIFMRVRAIEGLTTNNSGRFIQPESLGKLQRQLLKNAFFPINEIQKNIKIRFQVDLIGI